MGTISSKDSETGKSYIAFFDLDQTIIHANSGKLLVMHAYKSGMMTGMDLIRGILLSFLYRFNLKDTERIIADMVKWVAGVPESIMKELSLEIFDKYLLKSISQGARSELGFHKDNHAKVVILSSALSPVCQVVADHLEMDDVICSKLEVVDGLYTGRPSGKLCFGEEKEIRLREYCEKDNNKVKDAWYFGDSISDLPALKVVGHPVCINPDCKLKKTAKEKGWEINYWS
jgi:putative phosphoserine phosphatase/1-acylglycerol-3-phosphate O-acyltransferase